MKTKILRGAALAVASFAMIAVLAIINQPAPAEAARPSGDYTEHPGARYFSGAVTIDGSLTHAAEDFTVASTDDVSITATDDLTLQHGSTNSVIVLGTAAFAADIDIGNATGATDVKITGGTVGVELESTGAGDVTLDPADDLLMTVGDDATFTMESAGGIFSANGTGGAVYNIATDDTVADTVAVGSAKDNVDLAGEDIALTSADDLHLLSSSAGGILNVLTGTAGYVLNLCTDNSAADDINVGSALDTVSITSANWSVTDAGAFTGLGDLTFVTGLAGGADISSAAGAQGVAGNSIDVLAGAGGAAATDSDGQAGGAVTLTGGAGTALNGAGTNDGSGGDVVLLGGAKGGGTGTGVDGVVRVGSPTIGLTKATNLLAVAGGFEVDGAAQFDGAVGITATTNVGTCTLDGASPSVCTATVIASDICVCSNVGATAAIAANGCAVGLSGTTLTITSANGATNAVNYHCF